MTPLFMKSKTISHLRKMKHLVNFSGLLLFMTTVSIVSPGSCAQKKEKQNDTALESSPIMDTTAQGVVKDTQATTNQKNWPAPHEETAVYTPPVPKICSPNFNLVASPKKNQKIFYVSGFNPGEFKCWELLEAHGLEICGGNPCQVYFLDKPNVITTTTPPHFIEANTLKTNGIGRFTFDGKTWEIKGSSMWGRKEKGYAYYNTNNAGGG